MSTLVDVAPLHERFTVSTPCTLRPEALRVICVAVAVGVALGATVAVGVAVAVAVGVAFAVGVGDAAFVDCLSWKASCWELPLIALRPSTHAWRCWLAGELA